MNIVRGTNSRGRQWAASEPSPGMWLLGFGDDITHAMVRAPLPSDLADKMNLPVDHLRRTQYSVNVSGHENEYKPTLDEALACGADKETK